MPPVKYNFTFPNGENMEMYYIGTLCKSLGRTPAIIRKWEISGVIPDPCFRDPQGRRLYSQEQIDVINHAAEKCHISQGRAMWKTQFSTQVSKALEELREKYSQKMR